MPPRRRVALIVETSLAYGRAVLKGISSYSLTNQPWSVYLDLHELMAAPPDWLETWDGDGMISRSTTPALAELMTRKKIPIVDLTDFDDIPGLPHIYTDHVAVGQMAARHLLERGFRHFAFCGFSGHRWSERRKMGFLQSLPANLNCEVLETPWQPRTPSEHHEGWEAQQSRLSLWLASLPKPAGVFACNDLRGQQVLDACRRTELAVPEEVAVLGVDNDEILCNLGNPPLSSIVVNPERVGYEAAKLLDGLMNGESAPPTALLVPPVTVQVRQSTDVLAIDDTGTAAALRLIREHACHGYTVDNVSAATGLSRSILERRFRKHVGHSPQEEIRWVQVKRVRELLAETELTLERISVLAGFAHPEYLSVVFKRLTGMPPGQYRRQSRGS